MSISIEVRMSKGWNQGCAWQCWATGWKATGRDWGTGSSTWIQGGILYCVGSWALELIAQRGWGASLTGVYQELFGCKPVQCVLGWTYLNVEVGPGDPLWSLPTLPILWFYESNIAISLEENMFYFKFTKLNLKMWKKPTIFYAV